MPPRKSPEAFRTISEVADWLGVNPHVLRFWESKFAQIKPVKRAGGRRYYRVSDMELVGGIKRLLHEDGLTIKGAQKVLRERGVKAVQALSPPVDAAAPEAAGEAGAPATEEPAAAPPPETEPVAETRPEPETEPEPVPEPETRTAAERRPERGAEAEETHAGETVPPAEEPPDRPMPEIAPLPGTDGPDGSGAGGDAQPGLFADLPPLPAPPPGAASQDSVTGPAEPDAAARAATEDGAEPGPEPGPGPEIAPLPGGRPPLTVALSRLAPGQVPAAEIAPLLARARALRARMDAPAAARAGGDGRA